jgi:hypothetical protein
LEIAPPTRTWLRSPFRIHPKTRPFPKENAKLKEREEAVGITGEDGQGSDWEGAVTVTGIAV